MLQEEAPSPRKVIRTLDPEEDLVTARILFQRAAEVGDATAAMALGATYDPNVLAQLGVAGMAANVEKARSWYRKAQSQGSAEATRRLRALANHEFALIGFFRSRRKLDQEEYQTPAGRTGPLPESPVAGTWNW